MGLTSGLWKSVTEQQKDVSLLIVNERVASTCIFTYIVNSILLFPGPGIVTGVQGIYPYVVWNPPQQPNGVITGYRLTFTRSGTSRTVTTSNDQTFYVIQSTDIPWTSGSFTVTVINIYIHVTKIVYSIMQCCISASYQASVLM